MSTRAIAIVGLGPKGFYCLERLCAEYKARPLSDPLTVHLFERTGRFAASPVYDAAQPDHILVNICVGEIDLWNAGDPPPAAGRGPDFLTWYGEPLKGDEYLPRAVVGRYLAEGFERVLQHLPSGLTVSRHAEEVTDIRPAGGGYRLKAGGGDVFAEKVLLATGHSRLRPGPSESRYESFARGNPNVAFIPFAYPVVEAMAPIAPGARVAMLGIGLTFIDAVLELTEGRGGRFLREGEGLLAYERCGREPERVFPFSRTGLPMTPKAADLPLHPRTLSFVTPEKLRSGVPLDFERDVLPLFELEMAAQYHRVHPSSEPFDYRAVLDPIGGRRFATGEEFNAFAGDYMSAEIERARRGHARCGVKAAIDTWYEVRSALAEVMAFGGFTPQSHRLLLEEYFPRFKRVAFGPPIINIEKLLALQQAGIVDFSVSRDPDVVTAGDQFELRCDRNSSVAHVSVLVDARYPHVDVERDASPLYRSLLRRGMIRAHRNQAYRPGAIDMTPGSQFVVDAEGKANEDIAVIGIPTEGNLVGNLTMARDAYAGRWAAEVLRQLRAEVRSLPPGA